MTLDDLAALREMEDDDQAVSHSVARRIALAAEHHYRLRHPLPEPPPREYPFSRPRLMAGLRTYLADHSLRLLDIKHIPIPQQMPSSSFGDAGTRLRALSCGVLIEGDEHTLPLILKEPPVTPQGRVLTAIGQREYGVYRMLAPHLPLLVPGLVVGDEEHGWIVLEALAGLRNPDVWTPEDYREAIINLAAMHDRFQGLEADLANYPWLARPLDADYQITVEGAAQAAITLLLDRPLPPLAEEPYLNFFWTLIQYADRVAAPLRNEVMTLTHGDYWPGNIARLIDGRQVVFDWQLAGIGPAILDLVGFVQATTMRYSPSMPLQEIVMLYRELYNTFVPPGWNDQQFALLWDHALMWRFMMNWLPKLATMPVEQYIPLHDHFRAIWLEPVMAASERRLDALM